MAKKIGFNIIIENEKVKNKIVYIASSPDINVFAEGKSIDEAKSKFIKAVKFHLKNFPEDRKALIVEEKQIYEMPLLTRAFL